MNMAPASLPMSIRNSSQNLLNKYNANNYQDTYESKNPTVTAQYGKMMEKSPPSYSKKQPSTVRLEPINQSLASNNLNTIKNPDFSSIENLPSLPRKGGKGENSYRHANLLAQLLPIKNSSSNKGMKVQFKATLYIDQDNEMGKNYG